jgi:hypothetical protein
MPPHVPYELRGLPSRLWPKCPVVPMRWMVIYEYDVQGGALNPSSTKVPRPWSPWESSPSRKNPHGTAGNRTLDLMVSSQKFWPLDHEAGLITAMYVFLLSKLHESESEFWTKLGNSYIYIYIYICICVCVCVCVCVRWWTEAWNRLKHPNYILYRYWI